jgi:hypothetical protein
MTSFHQYWRALFRRRTPTDYSRSLLCTVEQATPWTGRADKGRRWIIWLRLEVVIGAFGQEPDGGVPPAFTRAPKR